MPPPPLLLWRPPLFRLARTLAGAVVAAECLAAVVILLREVATRLVAEDEGDGLAAGFRFAVADLLAATLDIVVVVVVVVAVVVTAVGVLLEAIVGFTEGDEVLLLLLLL